MTAVSVFPHMTFVRQRLIRSGLGDIDNIVSETIRRQAIRTPSKKGEAAESTGLPKLWINAFAILKKSATALAAGPDLERATPWRSLEFDASGNLMDFDPHENR